MAPRHDDWGGLTHYCHVSSFPDRSAEIRLWSGKPASASSCGSSQRPSSASPSRTTTSRSCASLSSTSATKAHTDVQCPPRPRPHRAGVQPLLTIPSLHADHGCVCGAEDLEPTSMFHPIDCKATVCAFPDMQGLILTAHESGKGALCDARLGEEVLSNECVHMDFFG